MGTTGIHLAHQQAGFIRRYLLPLMITLSLVASHLVLVGVAPSSAGTVSSGVDGGDFEIDGNFVVNTAGNIDWAVRDYTEVEDGGLVFGGGANAKETNRQNWQFQSGEATPGKNNLLRGYVDGQIDPAEDLAILRVAAEREKGEGEAWASFEFNQDSDGPFVSGTTVPVTPSVGDLLVSFQFPGNDTSAPEVIVEEWNGSSWTSVSIPALGATNLETITSDASGATLDNREFLEVSIDVSFLFADGATCRSFGQTWVRSNTAKGDNGQLKDVLSPVPFGFDTCGSINVTKNTDPAGLAGEFDIDLLKGDDPITSFALEHGQTGSFGLEDGEELLPGGDYRLVEEDLPAGFTLDDISCTIDGQDAIDGEGNITVEANQATDCTVTNRADDAEITVTKVVNDTEIDDVSVAGDDLADPDDFGLAISGVGTVDSGSTTDVTPGQSYTISETQVDGYRLVDLSCDGATVEEGADSVTVTPGPGDEVDCTFTNEPVPPTLTLSKSLGDETFGGNLEPGDFTLLIDGEEVVQDEANTLPAGTYTISEIVPPDDLSGYELTSIMCTNGDQTDDADTLEVTIGLGDEVTCTFTNAEIQPQLTLVKELSEVFGGELEPEDFDLRIDGESIEEQGEPIGLDAGFYDIDEVVPDGYELESIVCDNDQNTTADSLRVMLSLGDDVTCTFTNAEIQPEITLVKELGDTFGGDTDVSDFDLALNDSVVPQGEAQGVDAGTQTVSEEVPDGYALDSITCTPTDNPDDVLASTADATTLEVDLAVGDDVTCTFVNSEIQPQLTLVKELSTDLGGPLEATDFNLTIDGADPVEHGVAQGVDAGTRTVTETIPVALADAYDFEGVVCVDGDGMERASSDTSLSLDVEMGLGDEVICTFTNAEVPPTLTLVKDINTDFGGDLQPADFDLRVDGTVVDQGVAQEQAIGTVTIDEVVPDGAEDEYQLVSIMCDDGQQTTTDTSLDVALALGEDVTCTFTNSEIQPSLTVLKELTTDVGGPLAPEDFDLRIDGESIEVYGEQQMLGAGSYEVSEVVPDGYEFVDITCDNGQSSAENGLDVTVGLGEDVVCTVANAEIQPQLTLVKELNDQAGGLLGPEDFDLRIDSESIEEQGEAIGLDVGSYLIDEVLPDGYTLDGIECDDGRSTDANGLTVDLGLADDVTCIVGNSEIAPTVTLVKEVDGGTADVADFTLLLDGETVESGETVDVGANEPLTVTEEAADGYVLTDLTCTDDATDGTVATPLVLDLAQDVTCVLTNSFVDVDLVKSVEADESDDLIEGEVVQLDEGDPILLVDPEGDDVEVTYTFTVTNTGATTLFNLVLDDPLLGGDIPLEVGTLEPGESTTATASYVVTAEDIAAGTIPNEATVAATGTEDGDVPVSATDDANVDVVEVLGVVIEPGLEIVKEALVDEDADGNKAVEVGPDDDEVTVTYRFTITNTGTSIIDDLVLVDDKIGEIGLPGTSLAPGESMVVEADYVITEADLDAGSVVNVGIVTGVDEGGGEISADDDERVGVVEVLAEVVVAEVVQELPRTGYDSWMLLALGALLAALGSATLLFTPRRRT